MTEPLRARVFTGDARDLSPLQNGEVDLIVTSPPYWQIKDYEAEGQIGYGQSLHEYLFDLARVWRECFRVLKAGRRVCVNIGDQFARTEVYGRYKVIPLHCEVVSMCQSIGFDYLAGGLRRVAPRMGARARRSLHDFSGRSCGCVGRGDEGYVEAEISPSCEDGF